MTYNTNDPNQGNQPNLGFPPIDQPTVMPEEKRGRGRGGKGGNGNTPSNLPPNPISEFFVVDDRFAPPKTLAPRPWGTWILTLVGVLAVIGVMFVLISALTRDVAGVQESVDTSAQAVAGAVRDELANLPIQPTPDMSGIESQLSELRAQNTTLILRSQTLEAQLNVALTGIAATPESVAFFASNTPPAPAEVVTEDTTPSQTTATDTPILDVNQVMMKIGTPIHIIPNRNQSPNAILSIDKILTVEGVFTDRDGQKWLVFKPDQTLEIADLDGLYDREQVFVPFLTDFIVVNETPLQESPLRMRITDTEGRSYRTTPQVDNQNAIRRGVTGIVNVMDVVRNDQNTVEWVRVDVADVVFTGQQLAVKGDQSYVFIILNFNNVPAFSETDLAILERMPNTPDEFISVSATTQAPAQPTNPPAQPTQLPNLGDSPTPTPRG